MAQQPQLVNIEQPILTFDQEQEKWLGEAVRNVKEKSAYMHQAIEENKFVLVLKFASQMLAELRTGLLTPQHYYELYCKVFDEMQSLEMYFMDEAMRGRSVDDMYEVVQHAGNIVPRLYLLITVGSVFIKMKEAPPRDILTDLVEMCKGVQHPTRGLFLRHFLLTLIKNKLPDLDNEFEGEGGTVEDSAGFILKNFKEMVWLWVRMEHQTRHKGKYSHLQTTESSQVRREKERKELCVLVGFNIVRLSQLDGIDRHAYQQVILPRILEIILSYKEPLAQQYLLEVIIQVFPDEFHLLTLSDLLLSCHRVVEGVDMHSVLTSLMDRLGNYVHKLREGTTEGGSKKEEKVIKNMFTVFSEQIEALASHTRVFTPAAFAETQFSLVKMAMKTYPGDYERVEEVLAATKARFEAVKPDADAVKIAKRLVSHVAAELKDPNIILDLPSIDGLISQLPFKARRDIAVDMCSTLVGTDYKISTLERVAKLFDIIAPLVKDLEDTPEDKEEIYLHAPEEEFNEEQGMVSRVIHIIDSEDPSVLMKMYSGVRKQLGQGGMERMRITLKAMAFLYMRLAIKIKKLESAGEEVSASSAKCFQYIHSGDGKGILELLAYEIPQDTFFMYLNMANAADVCDLTELSYDLLCEAFTIYEENAADAKDQIRYLNTMISTLCAIRNMAEESYEIVATKVCQYSSKMLKKHDQSRMAALCSHLFWKKALSEEYHKKILECMKRSLKIADHAQPIHQMPLFVELLNQFLHYYAATAPNMTVQYVSTMVDLIREANTNKDIDTDTSDHQKARVYYRNTLKYIRSRQSSDERWEEIEL